MSEKIKKEVICRDCKETFTAWVGKETTVVARCKGCRSKRNRAARGRTFSEQERLRKAPPVKIFTKEEIEAVAHLMTPPRRTKKQYLRVELY